MAQNSIFSQRQSYQSVLGGDEELSLTISRSTPPSDRTHSNYGCCPPATNEPRQCFLRTSDSDSNGGAGDDDTLPSNRGAETVEVCPTSFDLGDDRSGLSVPEQKSLPRAHHNGATSSGQYKEWVPLMLRKRSAIVLAFFLWTSAIALQAVDLKIRNIQGISSENRNAVKVLRYIPTVIAILLGFGWKALVSDLKKITPWAAMSNTWKTAEQSLLLNYIDDIDIKSTYVAARSKHWPLFLVLLGGLLSGALVPLANALSYTDLRASASREMTLQQLTAFDLNGTLTVPADFRSTLPQGALGNSFLAAGDDNINFPPWTHGVHAFESFDHPRYGSETILRTQVMAFTSSLDCERINYTGVYDNDGPYSTIKIQASHGNLDTGGCLQDVVQEVRQPYNTSTVASYFGHRVGTVFNASSVVPPMAWLNITECYQSQDYRILVNVMATDLSVTSSPNTTFPTDVKVSAAGLICEPQYYLVPATIHINASTAKVIDFNTTESNKTRVDIGTSTLIMQAQLENPLGYFSRQVFEAAATNQWSSAVLPNSYDWAAFPQLDVIQKWSWLYLWNMTLNGRPVTDSFFKGVDSSQVLQYFHNTDKLYVDVNDQFGRRLALMADLFSRRPQNGYFKVRGSFQGSRVLIQQPSLRVTQAILILLGALALLCATFIRPTTCLIEDPGSIASISMLLSRSPKFESFIGSILSQSDIMSRDHLVNILCRLRESPGGVPELEFIPRQRAVNLLCPSAAGNGTKSISEQHLNYSPTAFGIRRCPRNWPRSSDTSREINHESRYRPVALRTYSRAALSFCVIGMIIALAALFMASKASNGFQGATQTSQSAWLYIPTIILVLVGYGIQSLEASVSALEKYWTLATNEKPGRKISLPRRIPIKTKLSPLIRRSLALFTASAISTIVYLGLKIIVAGLYKPSFSPKISDIILDIDVTGVAGFEEFSERIHPRTARGWASLYAEFASLDLPPLINTPRMQNVVGDLVIPFFRQNLTNYLDTDASIDFYASRITMESFAVHTNVTCIGFDQLEFGLTVDCQENNTYAFTFDCSSQVCHQNFDNLLSQTNISFIHDHTSQKPAEAFSMAASPNREDASLAVVLADFSNLTGSLPEMSSFCASDRPRTLTVMDLGSLYPTIRGVNCLRIMNKVNVTTTMQPAPSGVALYDQDPFQSSWWTTGYDEDSLKVSSKINLLPWPDVLLANGGAPIAHRGATVSPLTDFHNLLSVIAQAQSTNTEKQKDLLELNNLVTATQKVYELESRWNLLFILQIIQFKKIASLPLDLFPPNRTMKAAATAFTYQQRIYQDPGTSIALISLLAVELACVVYMSVAMPRKTILPTAPSSIAAQMSFVAGSALVERLRKEKAVMTKDSKVWDELFGLGWWPQRSIVGDGDARSSKESQMRWGIDVGLLPDRSHILPHQRPRARSPVPLASDYVALELGDMGQFENPFDNGQDR